MATEQDLEGETPASPLAERPAPDQLARAVAKAKIAGALFATKQQVKLGRYHLLEQVGRGGMGVVWGAWDPELERRVAVKVLEATGSHARARILHEGQALAKLSHPNVVPVYDVGVVDERVYLVMEWVRGENVRTWAAAPREVRDIVRVFRDAGAGLAAAHAAGLIHRDFKPENAVVGEDGRVRVLDFGLARSHVAGEDASVAGTPRYMAPEQAAGGELSPAADQFAFGVALRELVRGRRADGRELDEPAWIAAITTRAMQPSPDARFPSMDALLHALARDPRTVWGRRLAVVGALGVAGAAFAAGTMRASDGVEPCAGGRDEIARTWNAATQAKLVAHLGTLGAYAAEEVKRLVPELTTYAGRWADAHRGACVAQQRGELTPQLYERQLGCLSRAQVAMSTVTDVLSRATIERLPNALVAARALPEVERCGEDTLTASVDPPPAMIRNEVDAAAKGVDHAYYLALASDPQAATAAREAAGHADRLAYLPLVARAQLALGFATVGDGEGAAQAVPAYDRATAAALEAGDLVTFVEAYAREVYALGITPRDQRPAHAADVLASHRVAEQVARGTKQAGVFARALLFNNLGSERLAAGDRATARRWFERALAEPEVDRRHGELLRITGNLAIVTDDAAARDALFAQERVALERELGPNHALTLDSRMRAGMWRTEPRRAADELHDICARLERWHPEQRGRIDDCALELSSIAEQLGDLVMARAAVVSVRGETSPTQRVARGYELYFDGQHEDAARTMQSLGAELAADEAWWTRGIAADAYLVAALAERSLGRREREAATLRRALEVLADPALDQRAPYHLRRIARARALLDATAAAGSR